MAQNTDAVMIAGDGNVFTAPTGTTLPTDMATALDGAFVQLGYVSEDGVTWRNEQTKEPVTVWQSFYPVKYRVTETTSELEFVLKQFDVYTLPRAMGGGTVTPNASPVYYTYTPPDPETIEERAMVVEWEYGTFDYRLVIPRAQITGSVETVLSRNQESELPMTWAVLGTAGANPFTLITSDTAFAIA